MSLRREPIYAALFALAQGAYAFASSSRRVKHWDDVNRADCPALFMVQKGQVATRTTKLPAYWTLDVDLIVYVKTDGDHDATPATILNEIVDAIEAALEPAPGRSDPRQTLGGLVYDCRIEGGIDTDEGALGETAVAVIPVRIMQPAVDNSAYAVN